jgi:uncharacterized spore protein YtfJ
MAETVEEVREQVESEVSDDKIMRLAERLGATAKASAVFGDAVEKDGVTVIPVARVRWGIGGGSGTGKSGKGGKEKGTGIGAGVQASPDGYIEFGPAGAEYRRINDPLRYLVILLVLPVAIGLAVMMCMVVAALIARRMFFGALASMPHLRLPFPRITFRD